MSDADPFAPLLELIEVHAGRRWLYLNAASDWRLVTALGKDVVAIQPWKGMHDQCLAAGWRTIPIWEAAPLEARDAALIRISKDRDETRGLIAQALGLLPANAPVLLFGAKDEGMPAHEKWLAGLLPVEPPVSKRHARAIRFAVPASLPAAFQQAAAAAAPSRNVVDFFTQPGLFSAGGIDTGSAVLAAHVPADLGGIVADLGCGWGYLAAEALKRSSRIIAMHLFEADRRALDLAKANLSDVAGGRTLQSHWIDLTSEEPPKRMFDAILMNPPFHAGHQADPAIGKRFIAMARHALKPGGRLFMVANRHLPYEETLKAGFRMVNVLAAEQGFKVFEARL
jgi:16S rRNA (guanine1207-N2)-methyltransferase